jgi:outer membrane protein
MTASRRGWWAAGLAVALWAGSAAAAEVKVGYIDSARIFQEYAPAKEAQAAFERQVQTWRAESSEKEKVVSTLRAELRDQGPILSAVRRQEKEEALQRALSEYERFVQDIWGPQGRAAQENERMTAEIVVQIRSAVEKVAGERDLQLVLDSAGGLIVFADRSLNLTDLVLTELANRVAGTSR